MDYLLCDHCGESNEVKSKYLTFCNACGKKLPNNFSEWQKDHPSRSFDDYKSIVCRRTILHWEVEEVETQQRKILPLKFALPALIVIIFGLGVFWIIKEEHYPKEEIQEWASKNMQFNKEQADNWNSFTFHEGNFEMKFPSKPDKITEQTETAAGMLNINSYTLVADSEKDDNLSYSIAYITYPVDMINSRLISQEHTKEFFNYTLNAFLKTDKGVLKSKYEVVYGLYPGREITAGIQNGLAEIKCRFYLVENTLYILKVKSTYQNAGNASGEVFLNSFKLLSYAQDL